MNVCRIAIGFAFVLLLVFAAAGQQTSAAPEDHAALQASSSESESKPCQPQAPTSAEPFDTCKYLPIRPGIRVAPGIRPPHSLSIVYPKYSEAARKAKINGSVIVAVAINEQGGVDEVKVVRSLNRELDRNAMDAARQSKFVPATKHGKPVPAQFNMEMTFKVY